LVESESPKEESMNRSGKSFSFREKLKRKRARMKRVVIFLMAAALFAGGWALAPHLAQAEVEWRIIKDLDLKASPLDIMTSMDGKWLFVLTPGEILMVSVSDATVSDRIPVGKEFDRISILPRPDMLTLASSTNKTLQVILFQNIYKFDVAGLPFKGPQDAAVSLVVFDDYQ
jgi:hypothetical protein